jgi:flagellar L-ring protein precursor FlgH
MSKKLALPLVATLAVAGCSSLSDDVFSPDLSPIGASAVQAQSQAMTPVSLPMAAPPTERYAANSLWRDGARTFFNDQRASRVGDILTVKIDISDKAELQNSTQRSRTGSSETSITNFLGFESKLGSLPLPNAATTDPLFAGEGSTTSQGQGAVNREEKIELTVAAIVVQILPNGNLVIDGSQEVKINHELRELHVSGIIRPEDISSDNQIRHSQIAEARISYGGRGTISTVQRPGIGQRVVDAIAPW